MVKERLTADALRDYDDTRRLLYMTLVAPVTSKHNLAGTLINALKHHHAVDMDIELIMKRVVDAIEHGDEQAVAWLWEQVARITETLGD